MKFVGVIDDNAIAPNLYVGVKLDDNGELTCNSSKMMEFNMRNARISNIKLYVQNPNFNKLILYFYFSKFCSQWFVQG